MEMQGLNCVIAAVGKTSAVVLVRCMLDEAADLSDDVPRGRSAVNCRVHSLLGRAAFLPIVNDSCCPVVMAKPIKC